MKDADYVIKLSDGKSWLLEEDEDGNFESEITTFAIIDKLANAEKHRWCIQFKETKQRRWRYSSVSALSLAAIIDTVKYVMGLYPTAAVRALTPDKIVQFIRD